MRADEVWAAGVIARLSGRVEESYRIGRLRRRLGRGTPLRRALPPHLPVGVKLELTHACNLRCDFCYTDSPRHTLARTADLSDEAWRRVVEQALELGVVEAVLTGGEPLLRAPLMLELATRLAGEGVGVTLNTNGWFIDATLADRLAEIPGLSVNVSLDGATGELHDAARGVPGSWRRAVGALALLAERDVVVRAAHVVTPLNARWVEMLLENLWLLGVRVVRLTPVVPIGAASRRRGWGVDRSALRRAVADARSRFGEDFVVAVQSGVPLLLPNGDAGAPASLLVRPSGRVIVDAIHPFAFGHVDDGLAACWERIVAGWRAPEIEAWARGISSVGGLANASVVPYVEPEPLLGSAGGVWARGLRRGREAPPPPRLPRRMADSTTPAPAPGDIDAARKHVMSLGLARRYRAAPMRCSGSPDGERVVRLTESGRMCRLNAGAWTVLEMLQYRTVGDAAAAISARHPDAEREHVLVDTLRTARWLAARGVVRSAPLPVTA